jgi:hypothetical protein
MQAAVIDATLASLTASYKHCGEAGGAPTSSKLQA